MESNSFRFLMESCDAFLLPLRRGEEFDETAFQALANSIRDFHKQWANADVLPKVAISVFLDLPPTVDACQTLYQGVEKQRVIDAAAQLVDVIQEGL